MIHKFCFAIITILILQYSDSSPNNDRIFFQDEVITPPKIHYRCGYRYINAVYYAAMKNSSASESREVYVYYLNKTAERVESEGYEVKIHRVDEDVLEHMTYKKGNFKETLEFTHNFGVAPAGGIPAEPERAQYMAQLGQKTNNDTQFLCDGVLINRQWVLTAAHCFFSPLYDINLLRLGDYDITVPPSPDDTVHGKHIEDYPVGEVVIHPEYNPRVRYHDLALVPLPKKTPNMHPSINPICIAWEYSKEDFRGKEVVLTGWGATKFGAPKTPLLQQVTLKVYDVNVCQKTYYKLPRFTRKHPDGLTEDKIMCVGWDESGKDACNGDSGAPIVIGKNFSIYNDFVLAGIVSGGYGCGLKEYPGLYIPVYQPNYLRWIKEVAFKGFEE